MSFNLKKDKKKKLSNCNKTIDQIHSEKVKYFRMFKNKNNVILEEHNYYLNVHMILHDYFSLDDRNLTTDIDIENMAVVSRSNEREMLTRKYYDACDIKFIEDVKFTSSEYHKMIYCNICDSELLLTPEKVYTCTLCGKMFDKVFDGVSFNEMETCNIVFPFVYRRINYFTEWLIQIQASENIIIEDSLLDSIKIELKKRNIRDSSKLTYNKLKGILKEIDRSKYYEHIPLLISKLCGTQPLRISDNISDKLKEMFMAIQTPYEELKGDRKNFFSYPYILYKFCELLGLDEYLSYFQLLKNREKLMKQDMLWKKIVDSMEDKVFWKYVPTC
jgi:hypothetical protein